MLIVYTKGAETMKKSRGSSARGVRAGKNEKSMKPKKVDFSDIPELSNEQLSSMRRVGSQRWAPSRETHRDSARREGIGLATQDGEEKRTTVSVARKRNPCRGDAEVRSATERTNIMFAEGRPVLERSPNFLLVPNRMQFTQTSVSLLDNTSTAVVDNAPSVPC